MNTETKQKAKGGARAGAGRPKGSVKKLTREQQAAVAASGITPLDFMLKVMRDSKKGMDIRLDAAKAAAPYVHARLASIEYTGKDGGPIEVTQITRRIVRT